MCFWQKYAFLTAAHKDMFFICTLIHIMIAHVGNNQKAIVRPPSLFC